jgi:uncharacterized protein YkwD
MAVTTPKFLNSNNWQLRINHFYYTMKNFILLLVISFLLPLNCQSQRVVKQKTTPRPSAPTPSVSKIETGDFRGDMLAAVNKLRTSGCRCGGKQMPPVPPLRWNGQLESAAIRHAYDMSSHGHFDHVGTDNSEFDDRITASGYKWMEIGENIAVGYDLIPATIQGWINSASHCQQMLSSKVDEMGAAKSGKYWVQEFGRQRNW